MQSSSSLFEALFKKPLSSEGNAEFLSRVTKEHPYFSPAHFFLLEHTVPGSDDHKKQAAATAVLFNNPHWLHFQLSQCRQPVEEHKETTAPEIGPVHFEPDNTETHVDETLMEKEIEPMKLELKIPDVRSDPTDETPLFEPMHLVDYFASQGIKLSEASQTDDKLGRQLKSFTEWLKIMKKVHSQEPIQPAASAIQPTELPDAVIQTLAEKSNKENEVLTEAMADVLAKQGKTGKAIELYHKLSLLDPSKIAYFAAKIEQLKGT